jgi:hypothetical protein
MYAIIFWVIMLLMIPTSNLYSQENGDETVFSGAETEPAAENLEEGLVFGKIIFFPDKTSRPANDRHQVKVGEMVPVCIQLEGRNSPFIEELKEKTIGFRLILEDNSEPPHVLRIIVGNLFELMKPDDRGCFNASYKIPENTKKAVYQVADLLWATKENRYFSLRSHLYQFSQADELEVENPQEDIEPPQLIKISTKQTQLQGLKRSSAVLKATVEEKFYFQEGQSEIDWDTLRISYKFYLNQKFQKSQLAQCKINKKKKECRCQVETISPIDAWALNEVSYYLDSVTLQDKPGNLLKVEDPKELKEKSGANPIQFVFKLEKPLSEKFKKKFGGMSLE